MSLGGPLLLISAPLAAASIVLVLGRWWRLATVAGVVALWYLWVMVISVPLNPTEVERATRLFAGDTFLVVGRSLVLTDGIRGLFLLIYAGLSLLFLLSLVFPQGSRFVPGSLATLSPLAVSLMIEPLAFRALSLLVAAVVLAVVVQSDRVGTSGAALRYLVMAILAIPAILLAGWMLEGDQATLLLPASRFLLFGFVILLAGFPFHIWVRPIAVDTPPLVSAFLFGLAQLVIVVFIFNLILIDRWLPSDESLYLTLRQSGAATVLIAGMLALVAADFNRLVGSLLLLDLGLSVITLTMDGAIAGNTALTLGMNRFVSVVLVAVSIVVLRRRGLDDALAASRGLGRRVPFSAALLVYGCMSLIGLPLTPGFSGRWLVLVASGLANEAPWLPYSLLLAMIGATAGLLRGLMPLFAEPDEDEVGITVGEPWFQGLSALFLVVGLWFAVVPEPLNAYIQRLADLLW